jgi:membrane-associated protease RseP (regulator of RpoE activity)
MNSNKICSRRRKEADSVENPTLSASSRRRLHSKSIFKTASSLFLAVLFTSASCFGSEKSSPKDKDKKPPEHQRGWIGGEYKLAKRHGNLFMSAETVIAFPKSVTNEKKGLLITALSTNTPAYVAGLREGDLILELDHCAITSLRDFRRKIDQMKPGSPLAIRAFRNEVAQDYDITVGRETYNHQGIFAVSLLPIVRQPNLKFDPGFSLIALGLSWDTDKRAELGSPEQLFRRNCSPNQVDVSNSHWRAWLAMFFIEHTHQIQSQEIVAR